MPQNKNKREIETKERGESSLVEFDEKLVIIKLTEAVEQGKNNSQQIEEIKDRITDMEKRQETIHELTANIKLIAQGMDNFKESIIEIKDGQKELNRKMDDQIKEVKTEIKRIDDKGKIDFLEYFKVKVMPWVLGVGLIGGFVFIISKIQP